MRDDTAAEILVVDDTPANLKLLANLLTEQGYRVRPALSGELALRSAATKVPDLILLDVRMPGMDGYAVCQHLKNDPQTHAIPVIFISASNESIDKVQGFAVGGVDYITKPFAPEEVLARVRTHLELRHLQQDLEGQVEARKAELVQTHRALQSSEERLRLVIEATSDGVWDWDLRSNAMFFSDRCYTMLDFSPGELAGGFDVWRERIHPDELTAAEKAVRAHLGGLSPELSLEFRIRAKNDNWKWINSRGKVIEWDATGNPRRMVGTNVDITARKEAEIELARHRDHLEERVAERTAELRQAMDQLVQSEKLAALGHLVAGVAHELNTPLGNTRTMASALGEHLREFSMVVESGMLRRSQLETFLSRGREAVDLLERNTARAADLIGQFKQIAVDQTSMRRRCFNLRRTVEEMLITLRPQFKHSNHSIEMNIPGDVELDSYPGPLEQVLANLVGNSLSHGFAGVDRGVISIGAAKQDNGQVRIDFNDNGVGIPETILSHIFEPFFTTKLGSGGSGLGLYIVHNLVTRILGGTIQGFARPGHGCSFVLILPQIAPEQPSQTPLAEGAPAHAAVP